MSWTDERVETLKRMWAEGQSASQIAKELGGVTRNAVIGKVHRLGLSNRAASAAGPVAKSTEETVEDSQPAAVAAPQGARSRPAAGANPGTSENGGKPTEADPGKAKATPGGNGRSENTAARPEPRPAAAPTPPRRQIIPAGQPLPPQPSANEVSPEALKTVRETEKRALRLSLMELTERTCKWPVGDPATDDFWFCGLPSQPGKPYCEAHVSLAFQPMSTRRDRRR
ncbi:GcrA family cell cycle regulator [Alkalilacustris brevis]|uniref:GcrA family cell cycle regulator n=1 Tax=Alkalilacustris brevis TaxID=2026338 RepID=UPI000E0D7F4E|nr:GcrA family cell cycle regulator [Alkalilacustris brevis]